MGERQRHRDKERQRQRKEKIMDMKLGDYESEENLEMLWEGKHDKIYCMKKIRKNLTTKENSRQDQFSTEFYLQKKERTKLHQYS